MKVLNIMRSIRNLVLLVVSMSLVPAVVAADTVNVYSARKEALILPLLERFTEETGIEVRLVTGKADALLTRLRTEGDATPADVLVTSDAGRLERAKNAEVLQPVKSEVLNDLIPAHLRDQDSYWFGMSQRARVIFYSKDRVNPSELSSYDALKDTKWQGRVCIRSSSNIYNQSLVASMIVHNGVETTERWAKGMVSNFARPPAGGDTDQIRAVAAGECDVAIANTYYYGRLVNSDNESDRKVTEKVGIFWPDQSGNGTHVNVSGVGVVRYSDNVENAVRLLEFMASPESQAWYAEVNNEYPVVKSAETSSTLESLGAFKADEIDLTLLGVHNRDALQLMDRAGWK